MPVRLASSRSEGCVRPVTATGLSRSLRESVSVGTMTVWVDLGYQIRTRKPGAELTG
jgi:hypothetical protein